MTETLVGVSPAKKAAGKSIPPGEAERAAVRELVKAARARGESITGPDGLLKTITATVLESALEEEMTEHLGHEKNRVPVGTGSSGRVRPRSGTSTTAVPAPRYPCGQSARKPLRRNSSVPSGQRRKRSSPAPPPPDTPASGRSWPSRTL
jgi:hypothetical protein